MRSAFVHGSKNLRADFRKYVLALLAMLAGTAVLFATLICAEVTNERLAEGVDSLGELLTLGWCQMLLGVCSRLIKLIRLRNFLMSAK